MQSTIAVPATAAAQPSATPAAVTSLAAPAALASPVAASSPAESPAAVPLANAKREPPSAPSARASPAGARGAGPGGMATLLDAFEACARADRRCTLVCVSRRGHPPTCTMTMRHEKTALRAK